MNLDASLAPVDLGKLERFSYAEHRTEVDISGLPAGCHQFDDYIVRLSAPNSVAWVISRICDHNSGKLILGANRRTARCPLHGWNLDLDRLEYTNVLQPKGTCAFTQKGSVISIDDNKQAVQFPAGVLEQLPDDAVTARFVAHACVEFDLGGFRLLTDPWLTGPAFLTGWWLSSPPPRALVESVVSADAIYISHTHSDHLHPESLKLFDRDTLMIFPDFESGSVARRLAGLGFRNLRPLQFNTCYRLGRGCISLLKSGDFEEDSGLYLANRSFSALLTVDAKRLNHLVLPRDVDLLMTSFAGGASGYPVCFETLDVETIDRIALQRKNGRPAVVREYINATNPKLYAPYAGFFTSRAPRDAFVREHNKKMSADDLLAQISRSHPDLAVWNVTKTPVAEFREGVARVSGGGNEPAGAEDTDGPIAAMVAEAAGFSLDAVSTYFRDSGFGDQFVLYLMICDADFREVTDGLRIDFTGDRVAVETVPKGRIEAQYDASEESAAPRRKLIKIRREALWQLVRHNMPWEEAMIGFQCRFKRKPDVYNHKFWHHFSKVYAQ